MRAKAILQKELEKGKTQTKPAEQIKFPYEVFPEPFQNLINELDDKLNYPKEYTAGALIFAVSIITGQTRIIELKGGYTETASVYIAQVGNAGANKSRPIKDILKPIYKKDFEALKEYEKRLQDYNDDVIKEKPKEITYIVSDFTLEYLIKVLKNNPRGVGLYSDELLAWLKNLNKYNKGSSIEAYLSLWSNAPTKTSRATQETIYVNNPFISIIGTIQPKLLIKEFKDKEDNGFLDRFLFVYPPSRETPKVTDKELDKTALMDWAELVSRLYSFLDFENEEAKTIKCDTEAKKILIDWINENAGAGEDENIKGLYMKLHSYILRLTLIVYVMEWITQENREGVITKQTAERGIKLTEYFKETALKVRAEMYSNDTYLDSISENKQNFYHSLGDMFKTSDALELGAKMNISRATIERFITDKRLFIKTDRGIYKKKQ